MSCILAKGRKLDGRRYHRSRPLYRWLYEEKHGVKLTRQDVLHHTCGNPSCINVEHLACTTQSQHMKEHGIFGGDALVGQGRKTHCPAGHPYSEENTYRHRGERSCRTCRLASKRKFNAKLKAARRLGKFG